MRVEYWFDFSCPYAYLGSTQIEALAARSDAELVWKPMLLGGVFRAVNTPQNLAGTLGPAKARHNAADLRRWAGAFDVPLRMPAGHPMRTVRALRALLALPEQRWPGVIHSLYRAYWDQGKDLALEATVRDALEDAGVAGAQLRCALAANDDPGIKQELRTRTDEAIQRGVFGAPAMFVGDTLYWGQDRLDFVERALGGSVDDEPARPPAGRPAEVEFWYDFSSPWSYLAATQIERVAARVGAILHWRPMLLGAVFKQLGTPDVPLAAMSEAKRRYVGRDLHDWAAHWRVPFVFASRFPMRTVTALRLVLVAGDRRVELSHALFRALWVQDRDINDPGTLREILVEEGFSDPDGMLAATQQPAVKQQLVDATSEAVERGVFGAPTFIVRRSAGDQLFWGQDRLPLVERAARGWSPA